GCACMRDEKAILRRGMPHAHVTERVEDALVREDVVRQDQIVHGLARGDLAHEPPRRSATRRRYPSCSSHASEPPVITTPALGRSAARRTPERKIAVRSSSSNAVIHSSTAPSPLSAA